MEQTSSDTFSLNLALAILMSRRVLIAASSLGCAVFVFCASLLIPNTYKATSLVMPPDHSSSSALSMLSSGSGASSAVASGALAGLGIKNPSDLYVALMQSPVVEDMVIDRFHLAELYHQKFRSLVHRQLESNMDIVADSKSGIISVSFIDKSPERAASVANGIVGAFEKLSSHLAITDAGRRRLFFEQQLAETKSALTRDENTLKNTSSKTGVLQPEGTARAIIGYEAQIRAKISSKTVELRSMKVYLSDDNPQVQVAERELQSLHQQADALQKKSDSSYSTTEASSASLEYTRALRDVKTDETLYELLLKNLELAKLDEAREGNIVQVVSEATTPDVKNGPHRSFFLVGGFLLGLLGSSSWVLLRWARVRIATGKPAIVA